MITLSVNERGHGALCNNPALFDIDGTLFTRLHWRTLDEVMLHHHTPGPNN